MYLWLLQMKERRKVCQHFFAGEKVRHHFDPTGWVGYMSNLHPKSNSAVQIPPPGIMPGFRKKPLRKSVKSIPHSSCATRRLSCDKTRPLEIKPARLPITAGNEHPGLRQYGDGGATAALLGRTCRLQVCWVRFTEGSPLQHRAVRAHPMPTLLAPVSTARTLRQWSGASRSYPPLPTARTDVQRKLCTYGKLLRLLAGNE